jgi:hypothetical protein
LDGDDRNEFGAEARPQAFEEDRPKQRIDGGVVNLGDQRFQPVSHDEPLVVAKSAIGDLEAWQR